MVYSQAGPGAPCDGTTTRCLRKSITPPAGVAAVETVIGGMQSLQIWCYDSTGALNAALTGITEIRVQIATQTERGATAGSPGDQHAVVESRVRFRNI